MDDNLAPDCDMDCTLDRPMAGRSLQCHPSVIWQQRQDDKSSGADDRHGQGGEGGEERGGEWKKEAAAGFAPLEGLSKRPRGSTSVLQLVRPRCWTLVLPCTPTVHNHFNVQLPCYNDFNNLQLRCCILFKYKRDVTVMKLTVSHCIRLSLVFMPS